MKRTLAILLTAVLIFAMIPASIAEAATAPAAPTIKAVVTAEGTGIKITISKTTGAEGFYISCKAPGSTTFKRIANIQKNGTAARTYTYKDLADGQYSVKVRAYKKTSSGVITGKYSKVITLTIDDNYPIKLQNLKTQFTNTEGKYPTKESPQTVSCTVSDELQGAYLHLEFVDLAGNARPRETESVIKLSDTDLSFYATGAGNTDIAIYAYATEEDAANQANPIGWSRIFNVSVSDPAPNGNGNDQQEERKFATITFKNGYAYFGSYPQTMVTDSSLVSKLEKAHSKNAGSMVTKYDGKYYQDAEIKHVKNWYESKQVKWIILKGSATSDTVTLMASQALLCTGFTDWSGYSKGEKWGKSFLRSHLNNKNIRTYDSIWTYDFMGVLFEGETSRALMTQTWGSNKDLILLPSKAQVSKLTQKKRDLGASSMARVSRDYGYWLMDSAGGGKQYIVDENGKITTTETWRQEYGVVPVIKVDLKKCNVIIK